MSDELTDTEVAAGVHWIIGLVFLLIAIAQHNWIALVAGLASWTILVLVARKII